MPPKAPKAPKAVLAKAPLPSRPAAGPDLSGRLDDQLCFALYAATNALQRTYAPLLKALGLTYLQYLVLLVLWEGDDLTVGEIGRRLYLDSGTLTPVLRRLERENFVTRHRLPSDEREVRIRLTVAARRLEGELASVRAEIACRAALEPEAFRRLREELRDLRSRLTA